MTDSLIRPEAMAVLTRWREVGFGAGIAVIGVWLVWLGGYVLGPLGFAVVALGAGLALTGWRRLRFAQSVAAPGVVEVIEGEVRFFGPTLGGAISLVDLLEIRLVTMRGHRLWRLKQSDGQTLLIPIDATGATALYDAFAGLPGFDMPGLLAVLQPMQGVDSTSVSLADQPEMRMIWQRKGRGIVA